MKKILIIVIASILLIFSNANAGTDGENSLSKKKPGETKGRENSLYSRNIWNWEPA